MSFAPKTRTYKAVVKHINYTCSPDKYEELEFVARKANISLKELLRQMVDYALEDMGKPE